MSDTFDHPTLESAGNTMPALMSSLDAENTRIAIAAAGVAAYRWHIGQDVLEWNQEAAAALQRPAEWLVSGRRFASLLEPDNMTSRYDVVINSAGQDSGDGVAYQIEYQLKGDPGNGVAPMWVEDTGRWFGDSDGRPHVAAGVVRIITARHEREQELSTLSHTDALTGLMNRNRLDEALEGALEAANAGSTTSAFAVAAIRNLDIVNEAYGFDVADEVINAMAQRLRDVMRVGDAMGRYSGSKFGIILNSCSDLDLPIALERFLNAARDNVIETSKGPVWALLSIGAVLLPTLAATSLDARARAEESLSAALRQSSDSYVVHCPSEIVNNDRMLNARCATEIVECLRNEKFLLAFQPMVSTETGEVTCHEALLRMRDGAGNLVTAGHLVPVAERLGLIRLVDRSVVQLAIEMLHRHDDARLSVNVSATTANDPRWNAQIIEMIELAGPAAERLTVEITETTALNDLSAALVFLERLRKAGCCVAIDDFGAGFTSFRNLRDLPIDVIKLDGSYCRNLKSDPENVHFARTLIEMAHHFGIRTVAEWVETKEDADVLSALGIDFLQGNFVGQPSIVPPWTSSAASAFRFGEDQQADVSPVAFKDLAGMANISEAAYDLSVSQEVDALEPLAPEITAVESVGIKETVELEVAAHTYEVSDFPVASLSHETEEIFSGMEDGLARLREALSLLNSGHASAPEIVVEERLAS